MLGSLVTTVLMRLGWLFSMYGLLAAVTFLSVVSTPRRMWRSWAPWVFLLPIVVLLAWMPYAVEVSPDQRAAAREVTQLRWALLFGCAVLMGARAGRLGTRALRIAWAIALVVSSAIGTWEVVTHSHLVGAPIWSTMQQRLALGTFGNPNNFAAGLLAMIAGTWALRATVDRARARLALDALTAFGCVVLLFTQSRSGLLALLLLLGLEAWRRVGRPAGSPRRRRPLVRRRHALAGVLAVLLAALLLAAPPLAAHNPVRQLLSTAFTSHTARSDQLRAELITAAVRYLRESHYLGSGAGSFEALFLADPTSSATVVTNLHNAFVELLSQYGVVVGAAQLIGVALVLWVGVAGRVGRRGPRICRDDRVEMCGYLLAFVTLGCVASSALTNATWWMMLASSCAVWWVAATGVPLRRPPSSATTAPTTGSAQHRASSSPTTAGVADGAGARPVS